MTGHSDSLSQSMRERLDRLVVGELDDGSRLQLFAWCNEEPQRWRQCALAFLEAQAWQQAVSAWGDQPSENVEPPVPPSSPRRFVAWPVLVASALLAFLLGAVASGLGLVPIMNERPIVTTIPGVGTKRVASDENHHDQDLPLNYVNVPMQTNLSPGVQATLRIPVSEGTSTASAGAKPEMPEYVKMQWEKRGYQVAAKERFLTAHTADGRDIVVPVSGWELKYVGKPVY